MAEDVERTEKPTPRRRREAERKGQIAISQEVFIVMNLLAVTLALLWFGGRSVTHGIASFRTLWAPRGTIDVASVIELLRTAFGTAGRVLAPVLAAAFLGALVAGLAQTRGKLSPGRAQPDFKRLNPLTNLRRIIKEQAVVELGKSLLKLVIAGSAVWLVIGARLEEYGGLSRLPLLRVIGFQFSTILHAYLFGALALILVAAGDYAFQLWRTEKGLRMTKSEVKEDQRQSEGDPLVRARMRSLQADRARHRMMEAVPTADVVVTNPDHVAVALLYRRAQMQAPRVVAKGRGILAERIRERARGAGVPLVENPPLARALYRSVKLGQAIPEKLYQAVAELLAYVYRLDRGRAEAW